MASEQSDHLAEVLGAAPRSVVQPGPRAADRQAHLRSCGRAGQGARGRHLRRSRRRRRTGALVHPGGLRRRQRPVALPRRRHRGVLDEQRPQGCGSSGKGGGHPCARSGLPPFTGEQIPSPAGRRGDGLSLAARSGLPPREDRQRRPLGRRQSRREFGHQAARPVDRPARRHPVDLRLVRPRTQEPNAQDQRRDRQDTVRAAGASSSAKAGSAAPASRTTIRA